MPSRALSLIAVLACTACFTPPPQAPEELSELTRFLFREWSNPDPAVMEAGLANLDKHFLGLDAEAPTNERAFQLDALQRQDMVDINWPSERDPQACYGLAVARRSPHAIAAHAEMQTNPEQLPAEPSAKRYVRNFVDDAACFRERRCMTMKTENDLTRENFLLGSISMVLHKQFRWVRLEGEDRWGIAARSWIAEAGKDKDGTVKIHQSYSVDVILPASDGHTWRMQAVYSETDFGSVPQDTIISVVTSSTDDALKAADELITARAK